MFRLTFLFLLVSGFNAIAQFDFVVKPYLQYSTQTEMRVLWETSSPATTTVLYGFPAPSWSGGLINLDKQVQIPGTRTMHEVRLTGLEPETNYLYQVITVSAANDTLKGEVKTFKTAVKEGTAYSFAVFSDSQNNPDIWGKLTQLAWKERPNFSIHGGDLVGLGYRKSEWVDEFFKPSETFMSRIPMFTILGNHEHDASYYYQYFSNPDPEYYYTFDYGNARFYMIDSNRPVNKGDKMYIWLEDQLAKSDKSWNFVINHHAPYSSDENDFGNTYLEKSYHSNDQVRELIPLYEKYNVDIVFYGHVHTYERSWPLFQNKVDQEKGVLYMNVGGAGGGLENPAPSRNWFTRKLRTTHHFGLINIFENTLEFQAIDQNGLLFDHFEIKKSGDKKPIRNLEPPMPALVNEDVVFEDKTEITLKASSPQHKIRYTLDGSEPTAKSSEYRGPFVLNKSATLKAATFYNNHQSDVVSHTFTKEIPHQGTNGKDLQAGLNYTYYTSQAARNLPIEQYEKNNPRNGHVLDLDPSKINHRNEYYGITYEGFIEVKEKGLYTFGGHGYDKLRVSVHEKILFNELREDYTMEGQIMLEPGFHPIKVEFFNERNFPYFDLDVRGPKLPKQKVSAHMLFRK
jgi:predicted phosphodiesterase